MIPKVIHQTWRDADIPPQYADWSRTWRDRNPDWEWRLWTDAQLEQLVEERYAAFLPVYRAYPKAVQRADAGRYLVLHEYGGVYADLDTDCVGSLDAIATEERIVLSEEPREHWAEHLSARGLPSLYFNGVIASPKGHPFWLFVLDHLVRCRHARNVLDSTGPMLVSGCVLRYPPEAFSLHSCHLFTPLTKHHSPSAGPERGDHAPLRLSRHFWAGTWWNAPKPAPGVRTVARSLLHQVKRSVHRAETWRVRRRAEAARGPCLDPAQRLGAIDQRMLHSPLPSEPDAAHTRLTVLVPVRDAASHLPRCVELIRRLELPKANVKLVFCEGDSIDGSYDWLQAFAESARGEFRDVRVLRHEVGTSVDRATRWYPSLQRTRRSGIARARNHLIRHGLDPTDDWVLWIDADVCDYPADVVHRLMAERCKVVVPNCVLSPDGPSFDLNSFVEREPHGSPAYVRRLFDGLYQPPADVPSRWHLHDLRYLDRVPLDGIGGTMILVHASVHRAGVDFPELPYRDHIETEAFGLLARDAGVTPVGLPNLLILHSR